MCISYVYTASDTPRLLCLQKQWLAYLKTGKMSRFGTFEFENVIENNENQLTLRKTLGHVSLVREFLQTGGENREILYLLSLFLLSLYVIQSDVVLVLIVLHTEWY